MSNIKVIYPPAELFEKEDTLILNQETPQKRDSFVYLMKYAVIPDEGGVYLYSETAKYPEKGWPFREAVLANDTIKRVVVNAIKFLVSIPKNIFRPSKILRSALELFTDYSNLVFTRWEIYWKPLRYCTAVREIYRVGMLMAGEDDVYIRLVKAICMFLEFDNAYRYRFQDLMGEINIESLKKNPKKECIRLLKLYRERDLSQKAETEKPAIFLKFLPYAFMIKDIRNAFINFFSQTDITLLKFDEMDWYRVLVWGDYNFGGKTVEERIPERQLVDINWFLDERKKWQHG